MARNPNRKKKPVIVEYSLKKEALHKLLGAYGNRDLAEALLGVDRKETSLTFQQENAVETLRGSFKSWNDQHAPSGHVGQLFLDCVAKRLQELLQVAGKTSDRREIINIFYLGTYLDFYEFLPSTLQDDIDRPLELAGKPSPSVSDNFPHEELQLHVSFSGEQARLGDAISRRKIDQKLHYLHPDAAEYWKDVIDSEGYKQYLHCKSATRKLLETPTWQKFLATRNVSGMVSLGGGAPHKDFLVLKSMASTLERDRKISYTLVDYSYYMIESTCKSVERMISREQLGDRVVIAPAKKHDFLKLPSAGVGSARRTANLAWFIFGGTIGNVDEAELLQSVSNVCIRGDLFVVGAETVPDITNEASYLAEKYELPEIHQFVHPALKSVWHHLKMKKSIATAAKQFAVKVIEGEANEHSSVPGAKTVEISMPINKKPIVFLTSTRYRIGEFQRFAEGYGFEEFVAPVSADDNANYKLFAFRKT